MRHRVHFRKLGRSTEHRLSMLRTMTMQLIKHERIRTTLAKAKELRRPAENMVTYAKKGDATSFRKAHGWIREKSTVEKLFNELGPRYTERPGGYTRVLRAGNRLGDNAPMAYIEYVDNGKLPLRPPKHGKGLDDMGLDFAALGLDTSSLEDERSDGSSTKQSHE